MNENEYVDFYCQNLLWQVQLGDGTAYCDNDLRTLNYEAVLHNAGEFDLSKDSFVTSVKHYSDKCKTAINIDALWKLSILIWHWKALHLIAMADIRDVDLYVKFATLLEDGMDVESITITGKLPNKTKKTTITFTSDMVIANFFDAMLNDDFANKILSDKIRKNYSSKEWKFAIDVLDKRTIAYQIARELAEFFYHFNGEKKIDDDTKRLIMSVLSVFSLAPKGSNNTDYNKLFSDAKKGRLLVRDNYYQSTIIKDKGIFDFTLVKSPDSK